MLKTSLIAILAMSSYGISNASAQSARPDSLTMTCAQARSVVERQGGIVMGSGPHIYDRFVSGIRFCPPGDVTRQASVATRDTPFCPIGYTCVQPLGVQRFDD